MDTRHLRTRGGALVIDPLLALVRESRDHRALEQAPLAPRFPVPGSVAIELRWPLCAGCAKGIAPILGVVAWRGFSYHPECAHEELVALRAAA